MSVVQNTGANVLIQSATIVNVQFADYECCCLALVVAGVARASRDAGGARAARRRLQRAVVSVKEARFTTTQRQQFDFSCGSAAVATLLTHHYG